MTRASLLNRKNPSRERLNSNIKRIPKSRRYMLNAERHEKTKKTTTNEDKTITQTKQVVTFLNASKAFKNPSLRDPETKTSPPTFTRVATAVVSKRSASLSGHAHERVVTFSLAHRWPRTRDSIVHRVYFSVTRIVARKPCHVSNL